MVAQGAEGHSIRLKYYKAIEGIQTEDGVVLFIRSFFFLQFLFFCFSYSLSGSFVFGTKFYLIFRPFF